MFYQKTLRDLRAANESLCKSWEKKASELSVVQESYRERLSQLDELAKKIAALESSKKAIVGKYLDKIVAYGDLKAESRDTSRRLELLESVLRQLQIPVKLPARKK